MLRRLLPLLLLSAPCLAIAADPTLRLEVVSELSIAPGNITVTPDGRIILSQHQFFHPEMQVVELKKRGKTVPFPNTAWSRDSLSSVLGIRCDSAGVVWMLDNGLTRGTTPRLVGWNTATNKLAQVIPLLPPAVTAKSFVNDLAVDLTHGAIYIADPTQGDTAALIVVDLASGDARRVLKGHKSVTAEPVDLKVDGRFVESKLPDGTLARPHVGVNPLALDKDNSWLYFGPMHGHSLYRVRTEDLLDAGLPADSLAARVHRFGERPACDGITMDNDGNIYLGELEVNGLGIISPAGRYRRLLSDPRLSWADAFAFSPDGYMYVAANQLQRSAALNAGEDISKPPFLILRFKPLAPGVVGR